MSLRFEVAPPLRAAPVQRADVACFIGFVARRPGRPLPDAVRAQLRDAGWWDGPWARPPSELESLENLPVTIDSWHLFDWLYAWDRRPLLDREDDDTVPAEDDPRCATYLGAAVRSFFARGGRRAIVIRAGDPWPMLEDGRRRAERRRQRLRRLLPDYANRGAYEFPYTPHDPRGWIGIHHLYGLPEASLLLLPDLPDLCTFEPPIPDTTPDPLPPPEGFVECSDAEPPLPADAMQRRIPAPRLDSRGFAAWRLALASAQRFLQDPVNRRETLLLAALPLPDAEARRRRDGRSLHAQADLGAYLQRIGVLRDAGDAPGAGSSAFIQLGWPWLRTRSAADLPEGLEPADGVLAGLVAAGALARGTFRSVAGDFSMPRLADVQGAEPLPSWGLDEDGPTQRLARRVCLFAPQPGGWALQSDVTTAADEAWRFGGASRLMSTILRTARAAGESVLFGPNGPLLWRELTRAVEAVLTGFWQAGAFAGRGAGEAFEVRCGRDTMTQNDLDAGRLVVRITVRPAASIERITVTLNFGDASAAVPALEAAA